MVIPRSRSSGALSIDSKARYSEPPFMARYLVIAAVRLDWPWSLWPIVPMFTCGLVRSNFFLATDACYSCSFMRTAPPSGAAPPVHVSRRNRPPGDGAHNRTRTDDLFLTKEVLCRLSYVGPSPRVTGGRWWWAGRESNPHSRKTADLQSAELTTCSTYPRAAPGELRLVVRPTPVCSVGADDGTRTRNRRFTKPLLYQLSYVGSAAQDHTAGRARGARE